MKKRKVKDKTVLVAVYGVIGALSAALFYVLWIHILDTGVRMLLLGLTGGIVLTTVLWAYYVKRRAENMADELCEMLEELLAGRKPENYSPYEDTLVNKVVDKLLLYSDIMHNNRQRSAQEKQNLQELISDISHQVKTPIANVKMFTGILQHELSPEKREEFLVMMEGQIDKLDFLMQSLIKMSRLETGTFKLHVEETGLYDTIALAVGGIWSKAERKDIQIEVECDSHIRARHDRKWTAEALVNLLDNGVKYTEPGGQIQIRVRPWQVYTRIDITDTGMGISEEHYQDVFQRFYRAHQAVGQEGVGLGLYLAQSIMNRQKGYISVKSKLGEGSTFSVYLLS